MKGSPLMRALGKGKRGKKEMGGKKNTPGAPTQASSSVGHTMRREGEFLTLSTTTEKNI